MESKLERQIEGVPSTTKNPGKYCPKCNYTDADAKFKFCPECGTELKKPDLLKDLLESKLDTNYQLMFQKPEAKNIHKIKFGDLKTMNLDRNISQSQDGSLYISISGSKLLNFGHERGYFAGMKFSKILKFLITNEITNPILRNSMILKCHKDPWDLKVSDDSIVDMTLVDDIDRVKTGFNPNDDNMNKIWSSLSNPPGGRGSDGEPIDKASFILSIRKLYDYAVLVGCDYRSILNHFSKYIKESDVVIPKHIPALEPQKIQTPTKDDIELRNMLAKIKEDLFYSHVMNEIYTIDELLNIFVLEAKLIDGLDFRKLSKHIKIVNVDVYILNGEVDELFEFVKFREKTKNVTKLKFKYSLEKVMRALFGFDCSNIDA